jgi:hypothetical protein
VTKYTGAAAMMRNLRRLREQLPDEFGRALRQEAEVEATECKRATPVETGTLRGSIHAEGPFREGRKISASIVAGGAAEEYALIVHEDLDALHETGGAKYIERPLMESAPHMAERIAKRIDLNKAAR